MFFFLGTAIDDLSNKVKLMNQQMKRLESQNKLMRMKIERGARSETELPHFEDIMTLPMNSEDELAEMEQFLEDEEMKKSLVSIFKKSFNVISYFIEFCLDCLFEKDRRKLAQ